jgi:hypothetical protein
MPDKTFLLRCAYTDCGKETKIILTAPPSSARRRGKQEKKIQLTRYCEHCNHPNLINVPETWDGNPLILGEDNPIIGSRNGMPVIKGEKF